MTRTLLLALALGLAACTAPPAAPPAEAPAAPGVANDPLGGESLYVMDAPWERHTGGEVRLADLGGTPVLLALVYTNCASACPLIVHDMKAIAEALPEGQAAGLRYVLVSLDPARDTPEAMRRFADAHGLGDAWTLLRGDPEDVRMLAALLNVRYGPEPDGQVAHSNLIHVLGADGRLVAQQEGLGTDPAPTAGALTQALAVAR